MMRSDNVIANDNVYLNDRCLINTKAKELDVLKLRKLLAKLKFNPVVDGTTFIIEELQYAVENDILEIKNLKQLYNISAQIHNIPIENVQWDIKSAIKTMHRFADKDVLKEIFYWYDSYNNITPRFFMSTMIEYLNENFDEYKK